MDPLSWITGGLGLASLIGGLFAEESEPYTPRQVSLKSDTRQQAAQFGFGQDVAKSEFERFQSGRAEQEAVSLMTEAQKEELRQMQRTFAEAQPTLGTMRGWAAQQGMGGNLSFQVGKRSSEAAQARTGEAISQATSQIGSRYMQQLAGLKTQFEGLRQGALGAYTGALAQAETAAQRGEMFNVGEYNKGQMFNAQAWNDAQAAAYGRDRPGSWMTLGGGLLGMALTNATYPRSEPKKPSWGLSDRPGGWGG